jgi:DNA-binding PadR family transcriptional regulator
VRDVKEAGEHEGARVGELNAPLPRDWMRGAAAPVRGALLGLILENPAGGGTLTSRLRARLGETWNVDRSNVYRLLAALQREGLVRCVNEPRRGEAHSMQVVFHPTPLTAGAVSDWMASALPREPVRRGIEAKLAVASERDMPSVRHSVARYHAECLELAQSMPSSQRSPSSFAQLAADCARDAILRVLQAEIEWAQSTLTRIEEYAASGR